MAILTDFIKNFMDVFVDDFSAYGYGFDKCLAILDRVLPRSEEVNLVFNCENCHFMVIEGVV